MIPTQTNIEREPGLGVPVILHIDRRFPEAEVLLMEVHLALNLVGPALNEILQICSGLSVNWK